MLILLGLERGNFVNHNIGAVLKKKDFTVNA